MTPANCRKLHLCAKVTVRTQDTFIRSIDLLLQQANYFAMTLPHLCNAQWIWIFFKIQLPLKIHSKVNKKWTLFYKKFSVQFT